MTATTSVFSNQTHETLRETYRACKFKRFTKDGKPIPCRSPRCPCAACRRKHAEKESAILTRSFRDKPPAYCLTLKIVDDEHTPDVLMASYLKPFVQRIRDYRNANGVEVEYDIRLEFDKYDQPHGHLTIITGLGWSKWKMKDMLRGWWASSCGTRPVKVYCDRVGNAVAHARYVTKNLKDRRGVRPSPEDWNGRRCRLNWRSRKFLTKSKTALWKEQISEWFPQPTEPVESPVTEPATDAPTAEDALQRLVAASKPTRWHQTRPHRCRAARSRLVRSGGRFGTGWSRRWRPQPRGP